MNPPIHSILKEYWGYSEFRPLQEDIIHSALSGNDTLALLPTGSGKSVCYQVPAMAMDGICLVISPLIALMKDQVQQLRNKGISALAIHTGMSYKEVMKTMELAVNERVKLLYVSPERLQTKLFREFLPEMNVSLIAVDEAHCVSQWGYDFRPSYLQISSLREYLPEVPMLALTASATPLVREDIVTQLKLKNARVISGSFDREGLSYSCFEEPNKLNKLTNILTQVQGTGIVYCKSRKKTVEVCRHLNEQGLPAIFYHAGLDQETRHERQQLWTSNQARIMVSTNAFGMGIDKADVRTVVHFDVPDCMENYYQEAGRAGRDRKKAYAVLLYNPTEFASMLEQVEKKFPDLETIRKVYQSVADFLQIPSGAGEGNTYDFDLGRFCTNFGIDRVVAINALQILQSEGYCALNESVFLPPKVQFISDRGWLQEFQRLYPQYEEPVKSLLRNYEGLFTYPVSINESYLSRSWRKEREEVKEILQALHRHGIIRYEPLKDQPQFTLLAERVRAEYLRVNMTVVQERKKLALDRAAKMKQYVESSECRSVFIGKYFGDEKIQPCGKCDNCLAKNRKRVATGTITNDILKLLSASPLSPVEIKQQLTYECDDNSLWNALDFLLAEERVIAEEDGLFRLK
jgi:ATP-dependent DNA helicase RecQ